MHGGSTMRIDAHHHLWDQTVRRQSWMDEATQVVIGGPYTADDWATTAAPAGVTHGVFVQTVPDPAETPEVLALAAEDARLAAVVGWIDIDTDTGAAGAKLDALREGTGGEHLTGVRVAGEHNPDPDYLDSPPVHNLARALGERNLTLDLLLAPANLRAAERLAAANPETRMIVNHLAKPTMRNADFTEWERAITAIAAHDLVACKLSGFLTFDGRKMTAERLAPYGSVALTAFGPNRMMFGSDWPVSVLGGGYADAVAITENFLAQLSPAEQAAVWAGTARSWYSGLAAAIDESIRTDSTPTRSAAGRDSSQRIS